MRAAIFAAAAVLLSAGAASAQVYYNPPPPTASAYGQASWGQPYGGGQGYVYGRGGVGEVDARVYAATGRAASGYAYQGGYDYGYGYGGAYDYGYSYRQSYGGTYRGGCRSACDYAPPPPPPRRDCHDPCGGYGRGDYGHDRGGRYGYSEGGRYYYGSSGGRSYGSSTYGYRDEWGYDDDRPRTARGYRRDDGYARRRDRDCGCAYPLDDR